MEDGSEIKVVPGGPLDQAVKDVKKWEACTAAQADVPKLEKQRLRRAAIKRLLTDLNISPAELEERLKP